MKFTCGLLDIACFVLGGVLIGQTLEHCLQPRPRRQLPRMPDPSNAEVRWVVIEGESPDPRVYETKDPEPAK